MMTLTSIGLRLTEDTGKFSWSCYMITELKTQKQDWLIKSWGTNSLKRLKFEIHIR